MIFERHANLKYKYGNRHFWCRGYYVDTVWKNAKNTVKSGTSMSTPLVAGAAALMLEKNPELTNVQIKMKLKESARDMGLPKNQQGWGELDLERFMEL